GQTLESAGREPTFHEQGYGPTRCRAQSEAQGLTRGEKVRVLPPGGAQRVPHAGERLLRKEASAIDRDDAVWVAECMEAGHDTTMFQAAQREGNAIPVAVLAWRGDDGRLLHVQPPDPLEGVSDDLPLRGELGVVPEVLQRAAAAFRVVRTGCLSPIRRGFEHPEEAASRPSRPVQRDPRLHDFARRGPVNEEHAAIREASHPLAPRRQGADSEPYGRAGKRAPSPPPLPFRSHGRHPRGADCYASMPVDLRSSPSPPCRPLPGASRSLSFGTGDLDGRASALGILQQRSRDDGGAEGTLIRFRF